MLITRYHLQNTRRTMRMTSSSSKYVAIRSGLTLQCVRSLTPLQVEVYLYRVPKATLGYAHATATHQTILELHTRSGPRPGEGFVLHGVSAFEMDAFLHILQARYV